MSLSVWITFFVATLLLSLTPGPGAVNTMSNGLKHGLRGSIVGIVGLQLGLLAVVAVVGIGLGALVATSVVAFTLIKWVGVGYLVYLGIRKWREKSALDWQAGGDLRKQDSLKQLWTAFFVNLTNPKSIIFLGALFPQFLDLNQPLLAQYLILGATMVSVDFVVMVGFASLASRLRPFFADSARVKMQNRVLGSFFIGAGSLLAVARMGH